MQHTLEGTWPHFVDHSGLTPHTHPRTHAPTKRADPLPSALPSSADEVYVAVGSSGCGTIEQGRGNRSTASTTHHAAARSSHGESPLRIRIPVRRSSGRSWDGPSWPPGAKVICRSKAEGARRFALSHPTCQLETVASQTSDHPLYNPRGGRGEGGRSIPSLECIAPRQRPALDAWPSTWQKDCCRKPQLVCSSPKHSSPYP